MGSLGFLLQLPSPTPPHPLWTLLELKAKSKLVLTKLLLVKVFYHNNGKTTERLGEENVLSGAELIRNLKEKNAFYCNLHHIPEVDSKGL